MRWRAMPWLWMALITASGAVAEPISWRRGLEPLSGDRASDRLIFAVTTNDAPSGIRDEPAQLWCGQILRRRFDELFQRRPELTGHLVFQAVPAGRPAILTGGEARHRPGRMVIAICDPRLRLLALAVGIPDVDALHELIQDAEEARRLSGEGRSRLQTQLAARAAEWLPRRWSEAMQASLHTATAVPLEGASADANCAASDVPRERPPGATQRQESDGRIPADQPPPLDLGPRLVARRALADLAPIYRQDVRLRFGIAFDQAPRRLAVLEQHAETRRPWCEALLPVLVDLDWQQLWRPVVASLWRDAPFDRQPIDEQLLNWFRWHVGRQPVVLELGAESRHPAGKQRTAHATDRRTTGATLDAQLAGVFQAMPYRTVSMEQLAGLLEQSGGSPIDIALPSPARYAIFAPGEPAPLVIRAGDSAAKWRGRIRRLGSATVRSSPP